MTSSPMPALPVADDPLAADDPHGALRHALAVPADPQLVAEDVVLDWLLGLSGDIDPALAADRILAASGTGRVDNEPLCRLLREIALWPAGRLGCLRRRLSVPQ